jgi:ketosteroid isomerase-like protein
MSEKNVEIVREFTRLFDAGDRESWRRYFHPDVVWDMSASGHVLAGVYHGYEGVEKFFVDWLSTWDDYKVETREVIDAGDAVITVAHQRGRGKGSGVVIERDFFGVWELRDGKVSRFRDVGPSRNAAIKAAGLSE